MDTFKLSLAQLEVRLGKPEENIARAFEWIDQAASSGSQLILFPELWSCGYDLDHLDDFATPVGSGLWKQLSQKAIIAQIAIGGSILETSGGCLYNTSMLIDASGQLLSSYRKIHLFRNISEDRYLSAGDQPVVADSPWGKTGLAACYDLRFPELFRTYALAGVKIVLLPAEWPQRRLDHWRTLIRARAIENQFFVAAVNAVGEYQTETYAGHSALIDPWGETVLEAGGQEGLFTTVVDLTEIEKVRQRIPVLTDRRPDVYHLD